MRETITMNRVGRCTLTGKEVAQELSGYCLSEESHMESALLTKYCSGESLCKSTDCQFVIGVSGKNYTKSIQILFDMLALCYEDSLALADGLQKK
ncbi:MAG: hypothetical protein E6713_09110 [Sporomusaceae bacterium]|nr:hypothetical protein [Sporomusaceae bacterium]